MEQQELFKKLFTIITSITGEEGANPKLIKKIIASFVASFNNDYPTVLELYHYSGYHYKDSCYKERYHLHYLYWFKENGPIPGIKLFPDMNLYLDITY